MKRVLAAALLFALSAVPLNAQQTAPSTPAANTAEKGQMPLTIFFNHDQSKTLTRLRPAEAAKVLREIPAERH
jgi:hypothetical protein